MNVSIHSGSTRFIAAIFVLVLVLFLVGPHLMDPEPPLYVKVLLKPTEVAARAVGELIPPYNIGTAEKPSYEATPIHLLAGLLLVSFNILLYPFGTYIMLSLLSRLIRRDHL
jgi:hypothetical protein